MMYMRLGALEEEEAMVIYFLWATVKMKKRGNIAPVLVADQLWCNILCQHTDLIEFIRNYRY
jgi:hypothetical protein